MDVSLVSTQRLWFGPDDPVRAASAVAPLGGGWLVAQDDANHAGWWFPSADTVERVRLFPPHGGLDVFGEEDGTKHLKPDLEAACRVDRPGREQVLLLGSGSLPARTRVALVGLDGRGRIQVRAADLPGVYRSVREALRLAPDELNLEGACLVGDRLRCFQRGHGPREVASASVDVPVDDLLTLVDGGPPDAAIEVADVRRYDLGEVGGLPLAITDAVALPDGRIAVSATAEDTPDAVADGPILGSALAVLGDEPEDLALVPLPADVAGRKIEGLAVLGAAGPEVRLLAVVDDDDPAVASLAIELALGPPGSR